MIDQVHFATIKARLTDVPGIEGLSVSNVGGRLEFGMAGKIAATAENAPDADIESAIRIIFGGKTMIEVPTISSDTQPLPVAATPVPVAADKIPSNITGGTAAIQTVHELIAESRDMVKAAHTNLRANAAKMKTAATALGSLGDNLGSEADDIMAMVGQYKNDVG